MESDLFFLIMPSAKGPEKQEVYEIENMGPELQ